MESFSRKDEPERLESRQESGTVSSTNTTSTNLKPGYARHYEETSSVHSNSTGASSIFDDSLSLYASDISNGQPYSQIPLRTLPPPTNSVREPQSAPISSQSQSRWKQSLAYRAWAQSKGMLMVILSQFFGSSMNVMTQLLERDGAHGKAMHPFQILFTRMIITAVASSLYMWYARVPNPLGARGIRGLLFLRAAGGFFGVFGMYFSLLYMPLSEATVLTFLAPIVACYACSFLMPNEPFTRKQQLAGVISLLGVVLIAQPFSGRTGNDVQSDAASQQVNDGGSSSLADNGLPGDGVSAMHHLMAVGFATIGVFGAACAYVTIRLIGSRAHPLVSVTYFSSYTTMVSLIAMIAIPSVSFRLPGNLMEWSLLLGLGTSGFVMQFLLTAGLSYQPPSLGDKQLQKGNGTRATSMLYTQMLFALLFDRVVMDSSPTAVSWAGSGLILGSAVYVGVARDNSNSGSRNGALETAAMAESSSDHADSMGRVKNTVSSSSDLRDAEEARGLLSESDEIDAEVEALPYASSS